MKKKDYILLILILAVGFFLRIYNINWDSGFHMHPDERAIVMATTPIQFPRTLQDFFSPTSTLNPHFFAYGSFPMYLLKLTSYIPGAFDPLFLAYDKINLLGRFLSAMFDTGTILMVFLLGKKLFNKNAGFLGSFFYTVSVLPIQLSHFYAVDPTLTFFITLTLYRLIIFYERSTVKNAVLTGIFFGLAIATKSSAIALLASIGITLSADFFLIFIKQPHKINIWSPHIPKFLRKLFIEGTILIAVTGVVFLICEPYAFIDFQNFWTQSMQQAAMTKDAFVFPYTLQYVGIVPYWYELKNIFLWGEGPALAVLSIIGTLYVSYIAIRKHEYKTIWAQELILIIFFWSYFLVVGKFAVGWIRYMLPIYPILAICAAALIIKITQKISKSLLHTTYYILLTTFILIWPISFLTIYNSPNTRIQATNWINENIPSGKTLAIEHWDDSLPMTGQQNYQMETLQLYNPDTPDKWQMIDSQLSKADYIIIASNRLYVPLQKLTDCAHLDPYHCYPITAQYYKNLFAGNDVAPNIKFKKVAEFAEYPTIPFLNIPINDQGADESFTVYDHPKVMIFKKVNPL